MGCLTAVLTVLALAQSFPAPEPVRRVSVNAADQPVAQVIERIAREAGFALRIVPPADGRVTITLKDALPLEGIDAVCRAAGGLNCNWFAEHPGWASGDTREWPLELRATPWAEQPRWYGGRYRVCVYHLELVRHVDFEASRGYGRLRLNHTWAPAAQPAQIVRAELLDAVDDLGRNLTDKAARESEQAGAHGGCADAYSRISTHTIRRPASDARRISIKGRLVMRFVRERKTLRFDDPVTVGASMRFDDLLVKIVQLDKKGDALALSLAPEGRLRDDPDAAKFGDKSLTESCIDDYCIVTTADKRVAGERQLMQPQGCGGPAAKQVKPGTRRFPGVALSDVKALEIDVRMRWWYEEVAFEIKDIPLPR